MKTTRVVRWAASIMLAAGGVLSAQTLSLGGSSWGSGGSFQGTSSGGQLFTSGMSFSGAYFGSVQPDANTYVFGLVNTASPTGIASNYNVASSLAAGTSITLTFTGLSSTPDYIAYTGGALTSYSYNAGTLTLTASTVDPVASASDTTGNTLGSAFGLMIVSGTAHNFSGTVFRTDMYWDDINPLQNYSGTNYVAGLNAAGQNGATASFYAYLPMAFINAQGVTQPDDAVARLQKSGMAGVDLSGLNIDIYSSSAPAFGTQTTSWSYAGVSVFNFDGTAGNDDFVLATYTNSSWSDGNIGLALASSVPEPSTYAAILGSLALLTALWRRRALNNAPMR